MELIVSFRENVSVCTYIFTYILFNADCLLPLYDWPQIQPGKTYNRLARACGEYSWLLRSFFFFSLFWLVVLSCLSGCLPLLTDPFFFPFYFIVD